MVHSWARREREGPRAPRLTCNHNTAIKLLVERRIIWLWLEGGVTEVTVECGGLGRQLILLIAVLHGFLIMCGCLRGLRGRPGRLFVWLGCGGGRGAWRAVLKWSLLVKTTIGETCLMCCPFDKCGDNYKRRSLQTPGRICSPRKMPAGDNDDDTCGICLEKARFPVTLSCGHQVRLACTDLAGGMSRYIRAATTHN